jgi:quinol monooxygenase YgiN
MIVSILHFTLQPDSVGKLHEIFQRHRILETAMGVEGCWKLSLSHPQGADDEAYVIGYWQDRDAYQRWMDHPERGNATDELLPLMAGDFDPSAAAQLHEVLHSTPEQTAWAN